MSSTIEDIQECENYLGSLIDYNSLRQDMRLESQQNSFFHNRIDENIEQRSNCDKAEIYLWNNASISSAAYSFSLEKHTNVKINLLNNHSKKKIKNKTNRNTNTNNYNSKKGKSKAIFKIDKIMKNGYRTLTETDESADNAEKTISNSKKTTFTEGALPQKAFWDLKNTNNNSDSNKINLTPSKLNKGSQRDFSISPNNLIMISKEVFKFLREKVRVNIKTLNDFIFTKISNSENKSQELTSERNIKRRVYDSVNTINAIGLIKKDKKNFFNFQGKRNLKIFENRKNSVDKLKEEMEKKKNEIKDKKVQLLTLYIKVFYSIVYFFLLKNFYYLDFHLSVFYYFYYYNYYYNDF